MDEWRAGILTAGEARARRIPVAVCNERTTKPAVKRPSENVHVILNGLLKKQLRSFVRIASPRPSECLYPQATLLISAKPGRRLPGGFSPAFAAPHCEGSA